MFDVGSQVDRNSDAKVGTIIATSKRHADELMVEVRWASGIQQWIPSDHVKSVPRTARSPKERSIPGHLRTFNPKKGRYSSHQEQEMAARHLAEMLIKMGGKNRKHGQKQKNKNKANKMVANFNNGVYPQNMRKSLVDKPVFGTFTRYERKVLDQRIDRDRS